LGALNSQRPLAGKSTQQTIFSGRHRTHLAPQADLAKQPARGLHRYQQIRFAVWRITALRATGSNRLLARPGFQKNDDVICLESLQGAFCEDLNNCLFIVQSRQHGAQLKQLDGLLLTGGSLLQAAPRTP
jgi:hypothetical protein